MTTENSAAIERAMQDFLARGGKVTDLGGYTDVPRHQPAPKPVTATKKKPRGGSWKAVPRNAQGLTEAAADRIKKALPDVKKLLDQGMFLKDIRVRLGISNATVLGAAEALGHDCAARKLQAAKERAVPMIEAVVDGLLQGISMQDTCEKLGVHPNYLRKYWVMYAENNEFAEQIRRGHGPYPKHSDEDAVMMYQLYQELTGEPFYKAVAHLHLGEARMDRLIHDYAVSKVVSVSGEISQMIDKLTA